MPPGISIRGSVHRSVHHAFSKNPQKCLFFCGWWYQNESRNSPGPFSFTRMHTHMHTSAHTCTRMHPHVQMQNPAGKTHTHTHTSARMHTQTCSQNYGKAANKIHRAKMTSDSKQDTNTHMCTCIFVTVCNSVWLCVCVLYVSHRAVERNGAPPSRLKQFYLYLYIALKFDPVLLSLLSNYFLSLSLE